MFTEVIIFLNYTGLLGVNYHRLNLRFLTPTARRSFVTYYNLIVSGTKVKLNLINNGRRPVFFYPYVATKYLPKFSEIGKQDTRFKYHFITFAVFVYHQFCFLRIEQIHQVIQVARSCNTVLGSHLSINVPF